MAKSFVFTEPTVKALDVPAAGRVYHKDAKLPGLQVCVTSSGTMTYYFVRRIDGKPTRVRLGTVKELSVANARSAAALQATKVASGENPQAERKARRQEPTLQELFDHWLLYATAHKKPLSVAGDKLNWGRHLAPWAGRRLSSIKRTDVQELHSRIGRGYEEQVGKKRMQRGGTYAANRVLALLRSMFNKAEEVGYCGPNPAAKVKLFKEQSRDRFLHPTEMEQFFKALDGEEPLFRDFFLLCLLTGARRGNVQSMKWTDLDLGAAYWRIPETKGGNVVVVPLVPPAVDILERRRNDANGCPWVFPGHRCGDHLREPREAWGRICATAGLTDLHMHDLRRSLGSWMAGQNVSLTIIGKALGHRTSQATLIYSRLSNEPVRAAMNLATIAMLTGGGQAKLLTVEPKQEDRGNG